MAYEVIMAGLILIVTFGLGFAAGFLTLLYRLVQAARKAEEAKRSDTLSLKGIGTSPPYANRSVTSLVLDEAASEVLDRRPA